MKEIKNSFLYKVPESGDVSITILFGEKQKGNSAFLNFNNQYIVGEVKDVILGKAIDIKGKTLFIGSMVTDINPNTDLTSITYLLNDEPKATYEEETQSPNGSIIYSTTIKLE